MVLVAAVTAIVAGAGNTSPGVPCKADEATRHVDFETQVEPILRRACYGCHGSEKQESGLRLDRRLDENSGGDRGPAIIAGDAEGSRLLRVITATDAEIGAMPPEGEGTRLNPEEIELIRTWINEGAWRPESSAPPPRSEHWAFQPLRRPPLPMASEEARNPIDLFVLSRLAEHGLAPSEEADKATLVRRLYLDLLGLPPSVEEVERFQSDAGDGAVERLVDRLLSSPHFGERFGRHWLDLARYADSDGYEKDAARPHAWRHRDWVIGAINGDMPFDQFSIAQLAGDLIDPSVAGEEAVEWKVATGFHRHTLHNTEGGIDPEEDRVKKTVDRTNTFGTIWLGLTVACAQCHSHKYDPISQREYYSLYAFFNNLEETSLEAPAPWEQWRHERALAEFTARLSEQPPAVGESTGGASAESGSAGGAAGAEPKTGESQPPKLSAPASVVVERSTPRETFVQLRGDFLRPGPAVTPAVPQVLPHLTGNAESSASSAAGAPNRLDLARWLFAENHPLTARVTVNRIWMQLFGRGIVSTPDDFGRQGARPSHPELLDWLACEFRDHGYSVKHLVRTIVLSATWRQSSVFRQDLAERDPENELFGRQIRRRVEAEVIRDLALAVSGRLEERLGGPSVRPPQAADHAALTYAGSAAWTPSEGADRYRRGIYTFFQRTSPYPMFMTFDAPDSNECAVRRSVSNTPLQSLTLWNDPVFVEAAQALGERIVRETPGDAAPSKSRTEIRAALGFRLCMARNASPEELAALISLYFAQKELIERSSGAADAITGAVSSGSAGSPAEQANELAAWVLVARSLLNLDEFITRE